MFSNRHIANITSLRLAGEIKTNTNKIQLIKDDYTNKLIEIENQYNKQLKRLTISLHCGVVLIGIFNMVTILLINL